MDVFFAVNQLDHALLHSIQANVNPMLTGLMLFFTFFGSPVLWVGIAAALYWRGQENKSFFLMNLVVFASAAAGALKQTFLRPRPSVPEFLVLANDAYVSGSFPSGHTTLAAAAFSYVWKMIRNYKKILFAAVLLLVAFSRMYLGMHFPSDVVAGLALGLVIGKANLFARNRLFHRNFKPSKLEDELALVALVAVAVLAIMFLRSLPMSGLFIGFYAGFFLFKEMGLKQSILLRKFLALKYLAGFLPLACLVLVGEGIVGTGFVLNELQRFAFYLLAGFWISWIWPTLFERLWAKQ